MTSKTLFALFIIAVAAFALSSQTEAWTEVSYTSTWSDELNGEEPETEDALIQVEYDDFTQLYGTWYIWTPSGFTNHGFTPGAEQGRVVINEDGTYLMFHSAWDISEPTEGKWRLAFPREINGEIVTAIILENGVTGSDWAVAPSPSGKIRLLWAMKWSDGSATWVFDSELHK